MKIQLHSIDHAPHSLQYWRTLMDDLCQPSPHQLAKVLGLSERTFYRYNAARRVRSRQNVTLSAELRRRRSPFSVGSWATSRQAYATTQAIRK